MGEIFSSIEISSESDIQGAEDRKKNTESTYSSLHTVFFKMQEMDIVPNGMKNNKLFNLQIKIKNYQDKTSSMEEETLKKKLALTKNFFYI